MDTFYAIGDIHGCYDEFQQMLKKIEFTEGSDTLILIGDYIDRGSQSYEMINWLENSHIDRFFALQGNHEAEFIANVNILSSIKDNHSLSYIYSKIKDEVEFFDIYGTIGKLINLNNATINDLERWAKMFNNMPLSFQINLYGKKYYCVHAGITSNKEYTNDKEKINEFMLYARDEAYTIGGLPHYTVVAGHTPTILQSSIVYNHGNVFKYYNSEIDCTYYNIDCGCVYKDNDLDSKLACLRLYDEQIYYV